VYVRYNRKRLKGAKGIEDTTTAVSCLFHVLLDVCPLPRRPAGRGGTAAGNVLLRLRLQTLDRGVDSDVKRNVLVHFFHRHDKHYQAVVLGAHYGSVNDGVIFVM
jgi:hypothetical protein